MTMQMQRAFNSRMLTKILKFEQLAGLFNDLNQWTDGVVKQSYIWGRITVGNKFSQLKEGIAIHNEDGGIRYSDYRTLYITDKFSVKLGDKLLFQGAYLNVLQLSDEEVFGFTSYILEKSENWTP